MRHTSTSFTLEEVKKLDTLEWHQARSLVPYTDSTFLNLKVEYAHTSDMSYYRNGERLCKTNKLHPHSDVLTYQLTSIELGDFFLHDS